MKIKPQLFLSVALSFLFLLSPTFVFAATVSDNFNRANETPLASPWTKVDSSSGGMILTGNSMTVANLGLDTQYYYGGTSIGNDQFAQAAISVTGGSTSDVGFGLAVRASSGSAKTYYRLVVNKRSTNNIELGKFVSGSYTLITRRTAAWTNGDILRLEAQGSTLRIYRNGVQLGADVTDSSLSSGAVGVSYSSAVTAGSIDDWSGGDLASGGGGGSTNPPVSDTTAPIISSVASSGISQTGATITWTTDEASDSQIDYGLTNSYGSQGSLNSSLVTSHSVTLSGLNAGTVYNYRVRTKDSSGNTALSTNNIFTTSSPSSDTTPPTVSLTAPTAGSTVSSSNVTVSAIASDTVGVVGVQFKLDGANLGLEGTTAPYSVTWNTTAATNSTHTLTATARDSAGNSATSANVSVTVNNTVTGVTSLFLDNFELPSLRVMWPNDTTLNKYLWFQYGGGAGSAALTTAQKHDGNQSLQSTYTTGTNWQFHQNAYTENLPGFGNGWQFTKNFVNGTWQNNTYNRLRFWIKVPPGTDPDSNGNKNFEFGTYIRCSTCGGHESDNMHYYHFYDFETTGEWEQVIVDPHVSHQRGLSGNTEYGVLNHPSGEQNFNYFDLLVGFYLDFSYETFPMPANFFMDGFEFYQETAQENEDQVYSLHGTYIPSTKTIKVGWQRRKDQDTINHEVRYSFSDIHTIGWNAATPAPNGTIVPPGGGPYAGMKYSTSGINVSGQSNLYIAIKPQNSSLFSQIVIPITGSSPSTPPPSDTTAPTVSLTAPTGGATVSGASVTVSATASDAVGVVGVQFKLDGANLGAEDTTSPYSVTWNTTTASNTTHTLAAVARDAAGNTTTATNVSVTVNNVVADVTPPVISSVSISNITQTGATVTWTTNENADTQVDYGTTASYGSSSTLNTTMLTSHSVSLSGLSSGTLYHYRVRSKDGSVNLATSADLTFTTTSASDTTAPSAIANLSSSSIGQNSATLSFTAPGNNGNVGTASSYDIRYSTSAITSGNFGSAIAVTGEPTPSVAGTAQSYTLVGLSPSTTYFVAMKTSDVAGNISTISNVISFTTTTPPPAQDTTVPTASITSPANGATVSGTVTVASTATDPVVAGAVTSGVANVLFKVDGATLNTDTTSPYTASLDTTTLSNGAHTITARSTDMAGNLSLTATVNVTVNNVVASPPTPTLIVTISSTPTLGTAPLSNVSLTATVTGTATGNINYYFYCNRADTTTVTTGTTANNVSTNDASITKTVTSLCSYSTAGVYTAKVIVERNGLASDSRTNITVSAPATPSSAPASAPASSTPAPAGGGGGGGAVSGGGGAISAPPTISAGTATPLDGQVSLSWTNPADTSFVRTVVVKKLGSAPTSPTDGINIYEGTGNSFVDTSLTNGQVYYYALFPVLLSGTATTPARTISAVPQRGVSQISTSSVSAQTSAQATFTLGTKPAIFNRTLVVGSTGTDVTALQNLLIQKSYLAPGNAPGYFGNMTKEAVRKYQCVTMNLCNGSESTNGYGVVGVSTRAKLNAEIGATPSQTTTPSTVAPIALTKTLSVGARNSEVTLLQNFLVAKGYMTADNATGFFGNITKAAVKKFQCDAGIVCSGDEATTGYGMVGKMTRAQLAK